MSPTITATVGLISLLLCTLAAALPAPSNPIGHSASFRHHHRRLVIPSQNELKNDALTVNTSSNSPSSQPASTNPIAVQPDANSSKVTVTTATGTKLDLTKADTWIALQEELEALDRAEALAAAAATNASGSTNASATTNPLNFDDLTTEEDCDPDLAALLDPNATSTSNVSLAGAPNATLDKNVTTGVVSASPSPNINLVTPNVTLTRGTAKADQTSDDSQKKKQDAEESRKKAAQDAEENRKKIEQAAEEGRKKTEQDAEEKKKKAEQDAEEEKKKAEQAADEKKSADEEAAKKSAKEEADKKSAEEEAAKKSADEAAAKKATDDAEAARKSAADEAKKAADATVAQEKKDEEAKKAAEGKKDDKSTGSYTAPAGHSTGDATFYGTGLGACGVTNKDSDYICAVSKLLFDEFPAPGGNPNLSEVCGKKITATYNGKSVTVTVQDRCEACKHDDLDFSPEAFNQIGHPDQGRLSGMTWTWA